MQVISLLLLVGFAALMTFVMEANCASKSSEDLDSFEDTASDSELEEMDSASKRFLEGLFNIFGGYKKKPNSKAVPANVAALKGDDPLLLSSWQKAYGKDWYTQFRSYLKEIYGDKWYSEYRRDLKKKLGNEKWEKIEFTEQYRERYYMIKYGDEWKTYYTKFMTEKFGNDWKNNVRSFYLQNGLSPDFSWSATNSGSANKAPPAKLNGADPLLISSWQTAFGKNWYNPFRNYLKASYGDNWYHEYRRILKERLGAEKWKKIESNEKYRERFYMVKFGDQWKTEYTSFMVEKFGDNWKNDVTKYYQDHGMTPDFTWASTVQASNKKYY